MDSEPSRTKGAERRQGDRRRKDRRESSGQSAAGHVGGAIPAVMDVWDIPHDTGWEDVPTERTVVEDRRASERFGLHTPACVKHKVDTAAGRLEDISTGGARFCTPDMGMSVKLGAYVSLSFECLREGRRVTLQCVGRVVRSTAFFDGAADVRSMSVKFAEPLELDGLVFDLDPEE